MRLTRLKPLFLLGCAVCAASAQTNTNHVTLPEVNVTARRLEAPPMRLPYLVQDIAAEDLSERLPRTFPEALRETPGVMVQKTAHGQGSPFIRGFTGFRTLLLVDGIRLNNSVFRQGPNQYWSTVDPLTIARLEVVKGPSSVLYGSDAIGGTVNALTLGPAALADGFSWERRAFYRVSTGGEFAHGARRGERAAGEGGRLFPRRLVEGLRRLARRPRSPSAARHGLSRPRFGREGGMAVLGTAKERATHRPDLRRYFRFSVW
jgi:outer membrane receptor protein involved in Fe transport